jgi:hypothetical protein
MPQLLRTNPGLIAWLVLFGGCALVCTIVALLMSRSGASLRPVYWFAGFFLLIGFPQFLAHLYFAISALKREGPRMLALQNLSTDSPIDTRRESAKMLFGSDADVDLIIDARSVFGDVLSNAESARFASLPGAETVLLARFRGYSDAERAWVGYLHYTGLNTLAGKGSSQSGYAVTRPGGDRAYALHMDNMLGVWIGPDDNAIRSRMAAGGFKTPRNSPLAGGALHSENADVGSSDLSPKQASSKTNTIRPALIVAGVAAYIFVIVLYFFKGAAWAGTSSPRATTRPVPASELAAQIEAINELDIPFRIEPGERDNEFIATWRYADAKWIDLARAHGLGRLHRIKLRLDESDHTVRATEFSARYDWSAGRDGANVAWKATTGITFFHYEHQRVFGLQLDEQGQFKPELSYAYTFNLQEMKAPLIEAVTRSGWSWRPVMLQGPKWLQWLTE